jgi:hypothetical protein
MKIVNIPGTHAPSKGKGRAMMAAKAVVDVNRRLGLARDKQLLRACVRAWVAACVIDTIYELTRRRRPRRGESNFRIEIFEKNRHGQKGELGGLYENSILHA